MKNKHAFIIIILLLGILIAFPIYLFSQEGNAPPQQSEKMKKMFNAMSPLYGKMAQNAAKTKLNILEDPNTATKIAIFTKNLYDALVEQGFSKNEALEIVKSQDTPDIFSP